MTRLITITGTTYSPVAERFTFPPLIHMENQWMTPRNMPMPIWLQSIALCAGTDRPSFMEITACDCKNMTFVEIVSVTNDVSYVCFPFC